VAARDGRDEVFVGRAAELAELEAAVEGASAVVVTGPAGVGKSRLVRELVRRRAGTAAFRADLGAALDLEDALRRVGRALALEFGPGDGPEAVVARVGQALASRAPAMLWLDDADAVCEALAPPIEAWRETGQPVVVTSRRVRPAEGHVTVTLGPLPRDEAVALLLERARRVRPDFTVSEAQRPSVEGLVARVDALPLALELIAPRLRLLSPKRLLARLSGPAGPRDALRHALDRSFALLSPWEREALAQCTVFRDGFYLEAAEAVVDLSAHPGAPDVLTVLESLVDQSLLRTETVAELEDEPRLRFFGAVRERAAEELDAAARRAAEARHAAWFVEAAEAWDAGIESPDEVEHTARLVVELPNLEAAFERATDPATGARLALVLHMAYQRRGPFGRQAELVQRARALAEALAAAAGAGAGVDAGTAADAGAAADVGTKAGAGVDAGTAADAGAAADVGTKAGAGVDAGTAADATTAADVAADVGADAEVGPRARARTEAGAEARAGISRGAAGGEADPERLLARAELAWARVLRWENDLEASEAALERALAAAKRAGDVQTEAGCARNLAANRFRVGDLDGFEAHLAHALDAAARSGRLADEVNARNGLGYLHAERGAIERAREELERALRLAQETRIPGLVALAHASLSATMLRAERFEAAERHSTEAIAAYATLGYLRQWALEHLVRGEARLWADDLAGAHDDAAAALERARWLALDAPLTRALSLRGKVAFFEQDFGAARDALEDAAGRLGAQPGAGRLWAYAAAARAMLGHLEAARDAFEHAASTTAGSEGTARPEPTDPPGGDVVAVLRGFLVVGEAKVAAARGAPAELSGLPDGSGACAEARRLAELLGEVARAIAPGREVGGVRLEVAAEARWFRLDGGDGVDLTRRRALRGVLRGLIARHVDAPGAPLTLDDVLEAGWPGERMSPESGARRVYVTINRLRKLGLGELLLTTGDGYMLAPRVEVVQVG
jgi:predicted ATPase